ncbi:MAG: hypothetical protein J1E42_06425 [Akkermansiaceae bacterium]|nr:hypothetical protein [Akkermansiaceae bacterium]
MTSRTLFLPLAAAVLTALGSAASEVQMQVERVALFKNGYACVQSRGTLQEGLRQEVRNMPLPILGTFWWQAPVPVKRLEGVRRELTIPAPAGGFEELLLANEGKYVEAELADGQVCRGVVALASAAPAAGGSFLLPNEAAVSQGKTPPLVLLKSPQGGSICLYPDSVVSLRFAEGETPAPPTRKVSLAALELTLGEAAPGAELSLSCLSQGISWLPTYSLEWGDDDQAVLTGRATVMNDLVDLEHVQLELVSGAPALGDYLVPDTLANMGDMSQLLKELGAETRGRAAAGLLTNMRSGSGAISAAAMDALLESTNRLSRAEDLFYYSIPDFSCKRGETKMRRLFALRVPYKHVYTCSVPDQRTLQSLSRRQMPLAEVYHCVRLKNEGRLPWSAGVVTCTTGGRLVARSSLPFAGSGQECLVQLSQTFDAAVSCREELVQQGTPRRRRSLAMQSDPSVYKGYLTLKNKSDKPMEVELVKAIEGTATEASDGGQLSIVPSYSGNAHSGISWKLQLAPGEEKTCDYTYLYEEN